MRQAIDGRRTLWFECPRPTKAREPTGNEFARCPHVKGYTLTLHAMLKTKELNLCGLLCRRAIILNMNFLFTLDVFFLTSTGPGSKGRDTGAKPKGLSKWWI